MRYKILRQIHILVQHFFEKKMRLIRDRVADTFPKILFLQSLWDDNRRILATSRTISKFARGAVMQYRNVLETLSKAVLDRDAQSQKTLYPPGFAADLVC